MPPHRCDLLVMAAFPPELAALRPALGEGMRASVSGLDVAAAAVGIGLARAGVGAAMRLAALRPRAVLLLGTCGAYATTADGRALQIGDVAIARRVTLVEPAVLEGRAAFPGPMPADADGDAAMAAALLGAELGAPARAADVATTLAVTTDDPLAALLARESRCHVEHLEAYAVAAACAAAGVAFAAALGVANMVGSEGRAQWRANHHATSAAAVDRALAWIRAGGAGLPDGATVTR